MAELEGDVLEDSGEAQAVKARFNPWWIIGAVIFVVAVVLGVRSLTKGDGDDVAAPEDPTPEGRS